MTESKIEFDVSVEQTDDHVAVLVLDGASESRATITRATDERVRRDIPIGTRDAGHLTMLVNGTPVDLAPGPGRYTRGSFKVAAVYQGMRYLLALASAVSSRLHRDGVRLGEFSRLDSGEIRVWWNREASVSPTDAAIGYTLAAAFGTGAKFFLAALFDGPDHGMPAVPG
ncbi:MAG: hypothetical protein IRY85_03000 [Micromonosporaceae bacterium]|nr:hypothetical protein [Micromonosporaceae bacterium]